jgi:hypothetical protein
LTNSSTQVFTLFKQCANYFNKAYIGTYIEELKSETQLQGDGSRFPKIVAMIGGLLILIGVVLIGLSALAISGFLNVGILLERKNVITLAFAMVVAGLLDTCTAVIIARW